MGEKKIPYGPLLASKSAVPGHTLQLLQGGADLGYKKRK